MGINMHSIILKELMSHILKLRKKHGVPHITYKSLYIVVHK